MSFINWYLFLKQIGTPSLDIVSTISIILCISSACRRLLTANVGPGQRRNGNKWRGFGNSNSMLQDEEVSHICGVNAESFSCYTFGFMWIRSWEYMLAGRLVSVKGNMQSYLSLLIIWQKDFMLNLARSALTKTTGSVFSFRLPVAHFCPLMPSVIILQNKWRRFITSVSQSAMIMCP